MLHTFLNLFSYYVHLYRHILWLKYSLKMYICVCPSQCSMCKMWYIARAYIILSYFMTGISIVEILGSLQDTNKDYTRQKKLVFKDIAWLHIFDGLLS